MWNHPLEAALQQSDKIPHVVIVGGGFGGLYAAKALRRARVRITLVDRRNHHTFQPLLYQVASAALTPSDIAYPLRATLRKHANTEVLLADVKGVVPDERRLLLASGELAYDYLILASGATHSYFGNDDWAAHAPGLKSIEDALEIRRRVLLAYEAAEREGDADAAAEWMTFVVVGAGPTGVELAGALAEIARHAMTRDFRHIDPSDAKVVLVEGGERVLPTYAEKLSGRALAQLSKLGVEVRTGARVTSIDERGVNIGDTRLAARTVLWAAGVRASSLGASLGTELDSVGRVRVADDLSVPGHASIFVVGDLASIDQGQDKVPGVAPAAIQGGEHAARCIRADLRGRERPSFRYKDKGSMATIGRGAAVVERGRLKISGLFAWLMWMSVHILFLIGFRRRLIVLLSWAWAYLTFRRGARLITGKGKQLLPPAPTSFRGDSDVGD